MSRTRKLHDAFGWYEDDDDELELGAEDLIHDVVDLTLPPVDGDVFLDFDAVVEAAGPEATEVVVPVVLARRVLLALMLRTED